MYRSTSPNDPSSCNSTDAGTGLLEAEAQLTDPAQERTNSFWAVVLLLSGPPNSSLPSAADQAAYPYGYCPPSTWDPSLPFCTQPHIDYTIYPPNPNPTHEYGYSPLVPGASPDASYTSLDFAMDAADYVAAPTVGAGASIYAIGLGNRVRHLYNGDPNLAEEFMLYAAKYAGGGGSDVRHGAYYYAQTATDLGPIFNDIYNNITTRISQ
jgi:hypothetical protein